MSEYDLIPEETYEALPQEANDKFALLVRVAQTNLGRLLDQSSSGDFSTEIRAQFISIVTGIADALGVEGLPDLGHDVTNYDKYQMFQVHLAGVVARVRLQGQLVAKPHSVELGRVTKARIQQEIDQLRLSIRQSDIEEKKKAALFDKLDDLEDELSNKRLSFARTMAIAASIMTIAGAGTTALANGPEAKDTITRIIGYIGADKAAEEAERLRLQPPPKVLPDYTTPQVKPQPHGFFSDDLDDDVPF